MAKDKELYVGLRVRMLKPKPGVSDRGVIYAHTPEMPWPWFVRPDGWTRSGFAFRADEIVPARQGVDV